MNLIKKIKGGAESGVVTEPPQGLSMFRRELDRAFDRAFRAFGRDPSGPLEDVEPSWPPTDVSEDEKGFSVRMDVPGLGPKDIDVEVSEDVLTVKGARKEEHEESNGGSYVHERFSGSFARSITLPPSVDAKKVEAKYDKGVLTVTAPKVPGTEPKKVPVAS